MPKRWTILTVIAVIGVVFLCSIAQYVWTQESGRESKRLEQLSVRFQRALTEVLMHQIQSVENLAVTLMQKDLPDSDAFRQFAARSMQSHPPIVAFYYVDFKNNILDAYPDSGVLNTGQHIIADLPALAHEKPNETKNMTISPLTLPDGKAAYLVRTRLFQKGQYAGMIVAIIDSEKLMQNVFAISGIKVDRKDYIEIASAGEAEFWRMNQPDDDPNSVVTNFQFADVVWQVKVGNRQVLQDTDYLFWFVEGFGRSSIFYLFLLVWGLGGTTLVLLLTLIDWGLRRQEWLRDAVEEKTLELTQKNQLLEKMIVESQKKEEALQLSERRLNDFVSAIPDAMVKVHRDGRVLDIGNPDYAKELFIIPPKATVQEWFVPELAPGVMAKIEQAVATQTMQVFEYRLTLGLIRERESRIIPINQDEVFIIFRDVTEIRQEEACNELLHQMTVKVLQQQPLTEILTYMCLELERTFGVYPCVAWKVPDGSIEIGAYNQVAEKFLPHFMHGWAEASAGITGEVMRSGEARVAKAKEMLLPSQRKLIEDLGFSSMAIFPLQEKEETVGVLEIAAFEEDYWEEENRRLRFGNFARQMSIAINASRDRQQLNALHAGLEAAANAVAIWDNKGRFQWVNPAFCTMTGYTVAEVIGESVKTIYTGDSGDSLYARIVAQEPWHGEYVVRRRDGTAYYQQMTMTPVRNEQARVVQFIAVAEDITERKNAEESVRQSAEARQKAEKLFSMGSMAAGIAHEINQPLNTIKLIATGMLYSYAKGKDRSTEDVMNNLRQISGQTDRITGIINHMRSFIHRDSQKTEPCSLNTAVNKSLELIGRQIYCHGINVALDLDPELPPVVATSIGLEEVIINLLVNAMQALDTVQREKKLIVVSSRQTGNVVLEIHDNGPGICQDIKDRIFEPFFSTKGKPNNLGLGLSIVQTIVTKYNGTIALVPQDGGALFRIEFPQGGSQHENTACRR